MLSESKKVWSVIKRGCSRKWFRLESSMSSGFPDCLVDVCGGLLLPVELKFLDRWPVRSSTVFHLLRDSQVRWMEDSVDAQRKAAVVIRVGDDWYLYEASAVLHKRNAEFWQSIAYRKWSAGSFSVMELENSLIEMLFPFTTVSG